MKKKSKKKKISYSEDIYPAAEFRVRQPMFLLIPTHGTKLMILADIDMIPKMPCIMTGWVQDEIHLQVCHQSLQ